MTGFWAAAATGATAIPPPEVPGIGLGALVEVGLDQIEQDIQQQLQVLDRIELEDGQVAQSQEEPNQIQPDQKNVLETRHYAAAIDSGVCELMQANRGSDGDGQHTDQYSDAYITAVDSISSCDFGEAPEPGEYYLSLAHLRGTLVSK